MRSLLMAGTAGLFLTIGAASAYADSDFAQQSMPLETRSHLR